MSDTPTYYRSSYTDKKDNKNFLIYKDIQNSEFIYTVCEDFFFTFLTVQNLRKPSEFKGQSNKNKAKLKLTPV